MVLLVFTMEKLKSNLSLILNSCFNKEAFSERLIGSVGGIKGTTALVNRETGLLAAPNTLGGYNVYLADGGVFDVYAKDIDEKTASVCVALSYIEIFVENYLYDKFGSCDYLDSLDRVDLNEDILTISRDALNEAFLCMGIKEELLFNITDRDRFCCFGMEFSYEKVNSFISRGEDFYVWDLVDKSIGQIISADIKKHDNGIFQSISMAIEKKMFLLIGEEQLNNNVKKISSGASVGYEP